VKVCVLLVSIAAAAGLSGCIGAGMGTGLLIRTAGNYIGSKETPPSDRIRDAQEQALTEAQGGSPGIPVAWSDDKTGLKGTMVEDGGADVPNGCRRYQQTVILAGEALQGSLAACHQEDGSWKLLNDNFGKPPL